MKKIIIVGTTGSGKSTLAKKISRLLNSPHVQLDALFWGPNWTEPTDEVFLKRIKESISGHQWIVDGNYARTNHLTWPHADTVIWIDLPFWTSFYQSFKRAVVRIITQEELWPGTNNRESLRMLFSKDSILVWFFKTYHSNRRKYLERINDPQWDHLNFIQLRSRYEIRKFLKSIE